MANVVIIGMQWGDEGKGKIVDLLCPAFDVVARYQGGHNAGHTVKVGTQDLALHLVPSGVLHPHVSCVLGSGLVIDPDAFLTEVRGLEEKGIELEGRLFVSNRAHVILPPHSLLDQAREAAMGEGRIGTTARGIGPAYESKASRYGLRMCDLYSSHLEERLRTLLVRLEAELVHLNAGPIGHPAYMADHLRSMVDDLRPYLRDTAQLLNRWVKEGKQILFEGAQGTLLDLDHGTYPYVTSSSSTAGGACTGTGVAPSRIGGVIGVLKAYTTRVGGGPFVTELEGEVGEHLRRKGHEFGTTTGRPRRCGWLDAVAARYACLLNGIDLVALTKLDVLDGLEEIPVCVGYRFKGKTFRQFPAELEALDLVEPELRVVKGWHQPTNGITEYEALPQRARDYVELIEELLEVPVAVVSTGPKREETIIRPDATLTRLTSGRLDERPQAAAPPVAAAPAPPVAEAPESRALPRPQYKFRFSKRPGSGEA